MRKGIPLALAAALAVAPFIMSGVARANSPTPTPTARPTPAQQGVLQNNYYAHAGDATLPDGTVRIVNNTAPRLCALIYVVDKDQEMKECCGCVVTDKGTLILSVNNELTSDPITDASTTDGSIAIISSAPNACDPAQPVPTPMLEAWSTHPQTGGFVTEDEFTPLPLTVAGRADLSAECAAIELVGSGEGICTCVVGG